MKRADLSVIPGPNVSHFIYLAEFGDGVIKVGSSRNPRTRLEQLFDRRKREGAAVYRRLVVCDIGSSHSYEEELKLVHRLRKVGNVHAGREWFVDIRFGEALCMFKSAAKNVRDRSAPRKFYWLDAHQAAQRKSKAAAAPEAAPAEAAQ